MKRLGLALALWASFSIAAFAQVGGLSFPGPGPRVASASFSGPCDAVGSSATVFVGFVSCSAAYATAHSPAADICDQLTCTTTATINFLSTGYWDSATAAASPACAVACVVSKFYDSSGNANNAPASSSVSNALITFNALGTCSAVGKGTVGAGNSAPFYETSAFTSVAQPLTFAAIGKRTGSFATQQFIVGGSTGGGSGFGFDGVANQLSFYDSGTITLSGQTDNVWYAMAALGNGASSSINANGSSNTGNAGTQAVAQFTFMSDAFSNNLVAGLAVAGGIWPSAINVSTLTTKLRSLCGGF